MTIIIPGMSSDHHRVEVQPRNVRIHTKQKTFFLFYFSNFLFKKDTESLIERWKRNDMSNLLELHNKTPVWNEGK
jgi:tubby-related protein 1